MAAPKIDKEFLLKHHFWILAGLVLPLELFAFIWLSSSVAGDNAKDKKAIDASKKALEGLKDIKNDKFLAALQTKDNVLARQKGDVWNKAWAKQDGIFDWPKLDGREVRLEKEASFGDPIDPETCRLYEQHYSDYVNTVFDKMIDPTGFPGDGDWHTLVKTVPKWEHKPPDAEDLWLSMEDVWVQRELLKVIVDTNRAASAFKKVATPANLKLPGEAQSYQNSHWRLDLWLDKERKLHGKITNVSHRRLPLNAAFLVRLHENGRPYDLPLNYRSRGVDESFDFERDVRGSNPAGIFGVEQKLDKQSVPVKRLLRLEMAYNSDRTSNRSLKSRPHAGEKAAEGGESLNGLPRARYIDVTPQVRRMAVALTVLIDEDFMQDLLRSFANSKLRIQTTQMHWQHAEETSRPGSSGGLGMPGVGAPGAPTQPAAAGEEEESALVELSVYGIASIYERPKVAAPTTPGTPAAPGAPAGPGSPAPKK